MSRMFVKYCGFTREEDVQYAINLGVNALGFIFYEKSKRYIEPAEVRKISANVPDTVLKFGVFAESAVDEVNTVIEAASLDRVQVFADEIVDSSAYNVPVVPVYRITSEDTLPKKPLKMPFLLDSYSRSEAGGSGESFSWEYLRNYQYINNTIVAGGINSNNLKQLLNRVKPYGIDVSSGIEIEKGIKSKEKMKQLIRIVEEYNE
jgi:phosphoribosylanthranilate isomerase